MAYCPNCGVELAPSEARCPLCGAPAPQPPGAGKPYPPAANAPEERHAPRKRLRGKAGNSVLPNAHSAFFRLEIAADAP